MALYNNSVFGNISGEVMGVVASSNKGINFIKSKAKATDAKTQKQLARRAIYERFCKLWEEKKVDPATQGYRTAGLEENIFRSTLGFTLKHSENASMLWLTLCPTKGTMSAPIFTKTAFEQFENKSIKLTGNFLFPAFDENGVFEMYSGFFGNDIYDYYSTKISLAVYFQTKLTSREIPFSARTPNTTQNMLLGQKVFRSYWYVNKKTGQISKPLCVACDDSGNVETFYPFGK